MLMVVTAPQLGVLVSSPHLGLAADMMITTSECPPLGHAILMMAVAAPQLGVLVSCPHLGLASNMAIAVTL